MVGDTFGQLQGFRNQRNSELLSNYFRAIDEGRALASQDEQANQADNADYWRGVAEQGSREKDARSNAYFDASRTDAANALDLQKQGLALQSRQLDLTEGKTDKAKRDAGFAQVWGAIKSGDITDPVELAHVADRYDVAPDDLATLKGFLDNKRGKERDNYFDLSTKQADEATQQFRESTPRKSLVFVNPDDPFRARYKATTGIAPESDPNFLPEVGHNIIQSGTRFFGMRTSPEQRQAEEISMKEAALAASKANATALNSYAAKSLRGNRLVMPDVANYGFQPVLPAPSERFFINATDPRVIEGNKRFAPTESANADAAATPVTTPTVSPRVASRTTPAFGDFVEGQTIYDKNNRQYVVVNGTPVLKTNLVAPVISAPAATPTVSTNGYFNPPIINAPAGSSMAITDPPPNLSYEAPRRLPVINAPLGSSMSITDPPMPTATYFVAPAPVARAASNAPQVAATPVLQADLSSRRKQYDEELAKMQSDIAEVERLKTNAPTAATVPILQDPIQRRALMEEMLQMARDYPDLYRKTIPPEIQAEVVYYSKTKGAYFR